MRKTLKIFLLFLLLLCAVRTILPYAALYGINRALAKSPDFQGKVADLSLAVLPGKVSLVTINLSARRRPYPKLVVQDMQIQLQWSALLKGMIVAKVIINKPDLVLDTKPLSRKKQAPDWQSKIRKLSYIKINQILIHDGKLDYVNSTLNPSYHFIIQTINARIDNLADITQAKQHTLATLTATASTLDQAPIALHMQFDPLAKQPAFDIDASIQHLQLKPLNPLLISYTKLKVTKGTLSLYIEAAAARGRITGYVKPIIKDLQVDNPDEQKQNVLQRAYKTIVQGASQLLKNPQQKTVATKIAIQGRIDDPNASIWSVVTQLLRNAFIQALLPKIDNTIHFDSILLNRKYKPVK